MGNTRNLSKFGICERNEAIRLLDAWNKQGLPVGFEDNKVAIEFDPNSGKVFLANAEYQVAMLNGDKLEMWYCTPYAGFEGFAGDLREEYEENKDEWDSEDIKYLFEKGIIKES